MASATISLEKADYPLMMHLSIAPKYSISDDRPTYDPIAQTSNFADISMGNSWCTRTASSGHPLNRDGVDDDQQEDD
jgi:hypothetical protein